MQTFKQLREWVDAGLPMMWNDPDPIIGNDYTICRIEDLEELQGDLTDEEMEDVPILIEYNNGGSEAQVFLNEIDRLE
jgi:hypothetical protein